VSGLPFCGVWLVLSLIPPAQLFLAALRRHQLNKK
jgi:hypothetical protein